MLGHNVIPADKLASGFPDFPRTFTDTKIYLYLTDSKFFRCFEKLWVWIVHFCTLRRAQWCFGIPLVPILREDIRLDFRFSFWSVLEHCGPKLSPWGYPKWSDDKDIPYLRSFWTMLGALKFSPRSDKMSSKNLKKHFVAGTLKFPPHLRWYAAQHFKGFAAL